MDPRSGELKLAAVLSADVVGYSRLMAEDRERTIRTLADYREQVELLVRQHRGRVVDLRGDDFLAEFPTGLDAVRSAVEIQRVLASRNADLPDDRKMQFRIGIHLGDIRIEGEQIFGDGVNIAARLEGLAAPGGICISSTVHEQVENRLDLTFDDLGQQSVKNIPKPVRVYSVKLGAATAPAAAHSSSRAPLLAGGVAVAILLAIGGWWLFAGRGPEPGEVASGEIRSLAVLPLENLSGDPEQEYFADGMTEALITSLAKVEALRVISRTSVMQYKRARKPLPEIARELGVDAVVEGSVLRAGNRVRITAQLISAATDEHLWTESYDRDLGDTLALQSEVARAIASAVRVELTPRDERRLARARPVHPGAHEAVLQGRYLLARPSPENSQRARAAFERATELDPSYAPAYAGLANVYGFTSTVGIERPSEVMPLQMQAALKAVELDPELSEAQLALAMALTRAWDWKGAEAAYRRALELNPGNSKAELEYSTLLAILERLDEAGPRARRARELDPMSPLANAWLGGYLALSGEPERGAERLRAVVDLDPHLIVARAYLSMTYVNLGRPEDAVSEARTAVELGDREPNLLGFLGAALAEAGEIDEARAVLDELLERTKERYVEPNAVATVYAALGDNDAAFEWLERAYEERSQMLANVHSSRGPIYRLRADPRFNELMRRMGLPEG